MNEVIKIDVLIDVCPKCMGIWLDKGELEKIISRSQEEDTSRKDYDNNDKHYRHDDDDHDDDFYKNHGYKNDYRHKKRGGLSELFGNLFD